MPSREQIVEFIQSSETPAGKREIAKAFGLKSEVKIALKRLVKNMTALARVKPALRIRWPEIAR